VYRKNTDNWKKYHSKSLLILLKKAQGMV